MPIYSLTNAPKAFMLLGRIKKGDRGGKNGAPRDLDHFRLTYQPGPLGEGLEKAFRENYGDNPTEINVRFAYPNVNDVWDANYECYKKGGLIAKAFTDENGAHWSFYRDPDTSVVLVRDGAPVGSNGRDFFEKPFTVDTPIYYNAAKEPVFLEPVGRLNVVIPELAHLAVGYFSFQPQSPRDIRNITGELGAFDAMARTYGSSITGVPFKLIRRKEEITKNIKGVLSKGDSWVVHLDVGGEWGARAIEAIERLALPEIVDVEYTDVEEEFIPESDPEPAPAKNQPLLVTGAAPDEQIDPLGIKSVQYAMKEWALNEAHTRKAISSNTKFTNPMSKAAFKNAVSE